VDCPITSGHVWKREFWASCRQEPERVWRPDELVAYVLDRPARSSVGGGWAYSDTNYILLGMVLEKAAGESVY
jgi:D-alanyl-D-alanine carboxypeptidase